MKLRIKGDSLRLRLSRPEVDAFARLGRTADAIHFPGAVRLEYVLERADHAFMAAARFDGASIRIELPPHEADVWLQSDSGYQADLPLEDGGTLRILVEKDLQCLHRRPDEDESDLFRNPGRP